MRIIIPIGRFVLIEKFKLKPCTFCQQIAAKVICETCGNYFCFHHYKHISTEPRTDTTSVICYTCARVHSSVQTTATF